VVWSWVRRQPPKVKAFLAVVTGMAALVLLRFIVHDHDNLFVAAEAVHSIGICVLIYKLMKEKTCAGTILCVLSLSHPFLGFFNSVLPYQLLIVCIPLFLAKLLFNVTTFLFFLIIASKFSSFDQDFIGLPLLSAPGSSL